MPVKLERAAGFILFVTAFFFSGCSSGPKTEEGVAENTTSIETSPAQEAPRNQVASLDETFVPPTASINDDDDDDEPEDAADSANDEKIAEPTEGTPEWHIREILKLRLQPYASTREANPAEKTEGQENATGNDDEANSKEFRERNLEVVKLASQAIALTHKDPAKEVTFNAAVHHLLDARLQLAVAGEQNDVDALYESAEALQNSKPNSDAAATAALTIVNFSHINAVKYAQTEPRWIQEFARQAQIFAKRIHEGLAQNTQDPGRKSQLQKDASRAAQILMAAGQSCEFAGFADDAKTCYTLLKANFPESTPAQQVTGIVRRMNLKGQPLQLSGPTLDGNFVSIEDFKGKTVLVVFWSSQAKPFLDQLPALTDLLKRAQKHVAVLGICLDTDEAQLDNFLADKGLSWTQVFYSEPDKRGWNSPIAGYYGITNLPTLWIVDSSGVVAETDVTGSDVESKLKDVVRKSLATQKSAGKGPIQTTGGQSQE